MKRTRKYRSLQAIRLQRASELTGSAHSYRLARDTGAAPSLLQVLAFGPIVFLTWALGPNFNTKFRLVGPWKWSGAPAIMKGEHWRVIRRRKGFLSESKIFAFNSIGCSPDPLLTCVHFQFGPACRYCPSRYSVLLACSILLYTVLGMFSRILSSFSGRASKRHRRNQSVAGIRQG